jgi:hypothetical protein
VRARGAEIARVLIADGVSEEEAWAYAHRYFNEPKLPTEEGRLSHELHLTKRLIERRDDNVRRLAELVRQRMPGASAISVAREVAREAGLARRTVERLLADDDVDGGRNGDGDAGGAP